MELLQIADHSFTSRLFTGTGKFSSSQLMEEGLREGCGKITAILKNQQLFLMRKGA